MKIRDLITEQHVSRHRDEVFAFFDRPENLARITPRWLDFRILTPQPLTMREGAVIDYLIRLGPLPTRWRSIISVYDPPHRFVDEQLMGPYSFWHHTHEFAEIPGGTLIRDHVRYLLPFGFLGDVAHALMVERQLEGIFAHRRKAIDRMFGPKIEEERP